MYLPFFSVSCRFPSILTGGLKYGEYHKHHRSSQLFFRDLVSDFNKSLVNISLYTAFRYFNNRDIPSNDKQNIERIRKAFVTQEAVEGGNVTHWDGNKIRKILERDSIYREDFSTLMSIYYKHLDQSKLFSRALALFFVIFGLTIFSLPSIEVFVMVLIKLLGL